MTEDEGLRQQIRYSVTVEDTIAGTEYHMLRSPAALQSQKRQRVIFTVALALAFLLVGNAMRASDPSMFAPWFPLLCGLFGGVLYNILVASKISFPQLLRHRLRKYYSKPETAKYLGEHSLEVDEQGFTHRTAYTESRLAWGALARIESESDRTYLYITASQFYVVPHKRILEGDFAKILKAIKAHYKPDQVLQPKPLTKPAQIAEDTGQAGQNLPGKIGAVGAEDTQAQGENSAGH